MTSKLTIGPVRNLPKPFANPSRQGFSRPVDSTARSGYTLLELLIAVSLTLVLMYAIARIFSQVGSMMSQTQHTLEMTNNLRTTKDRLVTDLENLTVPKLQAPTSQYGFFSYIEGWNQSFWRLWDRLGTNMGIFPPIPALNSETNGQDFTVGDTDDILSFTVRAPEGQWFKGRCLKESFDPSLGLPPDENDLEIIESEYAEVIWFVRGTTLYRRVLLIVPDEFFQKRLARLTDFVNGILGEDNIVSPKQGFGVFRYFDISVHLDPSKGLVANTLSDLANRKNRYGYWSSVVPNQTFVKNDGKIIGYGYWSSVVPNEEELNEYSGNWCHPPIFYEEPNPPSYFIDEGLHGETASWYWLRLPTLSESATENYANPDRLYSFQAGVPFGGTIYNYGMSQTTYWPGAYLDLYHSANTPNGLSNSKKLPGDDSPTNFFIDYWLNPNAWAFSRKEMAQDPVTGQLPTNYVGDPLPTLTQDVILTNVISFDVKAWNPATLEGETPGFVDLGEFYKNLENLEDIPDILRNDILHNNSNDFRSGGNYGQILMIEDPVKTFKFQNYYPLYDKDSQPTGLTMARPIMPAVFDTWTEDYEKEFLSTPWNYQAEGGTGISFGNSIRPGFSVEDIPLDGKITASDLPDYPPPYDAELKGLQIEIRVFDPVSRMIKNTTAVVRFGE